MSEPFFRPAPSGEDEVHLTDGLNPDQRKAVLHEEGPLLLIAGAGSGKTRVLTHRIAHLVSARGVPPSRILAITFTNRAASEMKARLEALLGPAASQMWVSTFHSACVRILRRHAEVLGWKSSFTIYDQGDALRLVGYVIRDHGLDPKRFTARAVLAAISGAKNDLVSVSGYAERAHSPFERRVAAVYADYAARCRAANALDFDDLLVATVQLFEMAPDVLSYYQNRFVHIAVDEYQDTNAVQARLVVLLGAGHRNVFVVGDSDQSVYGFRGADISNILDFEGSFPDATVMLLEQNYRSTQNILDAANALIANNALRRPKSLWTKEGPGEPVVHYRARDDNAEASWVADQIEGLVSEKGIPASDIAVFYRTNALSRAVEEELVRRSIAYRMVGGARFFDRREVRDLLGWLRAIANPEDEVSLKRAMGAPKRGIGDATIARLDQWSSANGKSFAQALGDPAAAGVKGRSASAVADFMRLLGEMSAMAASELPEEVAEAVLERSGYRAELESEDSLEAAGRLENLGELVGEAAKHESLAEFLESVSLVSETEGDGGESQEQVTLMTLHSAKGLEFPVVFIIGMEEGIFPHSRALGKPEELEEERRLAYVGFTRARQRLFVTSAWRRNQWGAGQFNPASRFLSEVPASCLTLAPDSFDGSEWSFSQLASQSWDGVERVDGNGVTRRFVDDTVRGRRPTSPGRRSPAVLDLAAGEDVVHGKWGEGVVISVRGEGERAEAVVRFAGIGEKTLLLSIAPLKRA